MDEKNGIGWAVKNMWDEKKVCREGWNEKGIFLFLVPGSAFQVKKSALVGIYPEGTYIRHQPYIALNSAKEVVVPWLCSQDDLLSTDWMIAE